MQRKLCTVIQGPYNRQSVFHYEFANPIVSTWTDAIGKFENDNFGFANPEFVISEKPEPGYGNINLQCASTTAGLKRAKELGYTHAFKVRSDIVFSDVYDLLGKFNFLDLYFLCYHNHDGGYFVDYFNFGPIDMMLDFWDYYDTEPTVPFAERKLFNNGLAKGLFGKVSYILPILDMFNIDCYWKKYSVNIRDYAKDPLYTTNIKSFK